MSTIGVKEDEKAVAGIPSVQCERITPTTANGVPHLILTWDEKRVRITRERFTRALTEADPPIQIGRVPGTGERGVCISVFMLQAGEDRMATPIGLVVVLPFWMLLLAAANVILPPLIGMTVAEPIVR